MDMYLAALGARMMATPGTPWARRLTDVIDVLRYVIIASIVFGLITLSRVSRRR